MPGFFLPPKWERRFTGKDFEFDTSLLSLLLQLLLFIVFSSFPFPFPVQLNSSSLASSSTLNIEVFLDREQPSRCCGCCCGSFPSWKSFPPDIRKVVFLLPR